MLVNTFLGSLAAKIAVGVGLITATVTAAGAAGVLPEPAQHAVASVVEATTPFALPDAVGAVGTDDSAKVATTDDAKKTGDAKKDDDTTAHDKAGDDATHPLNHGACVSAAAHTETEPGTHDKTVSSVAKSDCGKTDKATSTSTTAPGSSSSSTSSTSSTSTTVANTRSANAGPGSTRTEPGHGADDGNGANRGKGNAGKD